MRYDQQSILTRDDNPNGGTDYEADFPFMLGESWVLKWEEGRSQHGYDACRLRPVYSADPRFQESKGRCWLKSWTFVPTERGNIASGCGAELIPFAEGVHLLVTHEVFAFPLPKDGPFISINTDGDLVALAWSKARAGELSVGVAPVSVVQLNPGQELRFPASSDVRPVAYTHDELVDGALGLKRLPAVQD